MKIECSGRFTMGGCIPYCMSKHAVRSFCDGMRKEVQDFGIKVIAIEPCLYKTAIVQYDTLMKNLDNVWKETPKGVQSVYGNNFRNNYNKNLKKVLKLERKQISEVVNAMIDAVVLKQPNNTYKCGGIFEFLLIYPLSYLPERAQNFAINLLLILL